LSRTALVNSLTLSLCSTVLDVLIGFGIAWLCVRRRIAGGDWLDTLAMLPLAVPGLVIAFGYMGCFSGAFPDTFLDPRHNPMALLAVSYGIRRLPYMVRSAHAGLEQVSRTYEEAAANLGASPLRVVWRITLPLMVANLLAGGILCFSFSMLEVSDSLILAQSEAFYPITKAIYVLMDGLENGLNVASALGVWAMALLGAGILWASALMGKRIGQMFRAG
jgi:iron(III) transport system permease protein